MYVSACVCVCARVLRQPPQLIDLGYLGVVRIDMGLDCFNPEQCPLFTVAGIRQSTEAVPTCLPHLSLYHCW